MVAYKRAKRGGEEDDDEKEQVKLGRASWLALQEERRGKGRGLDELGQLEHRGKGV
jgi:hypothetical protein